MKQEAPLLKNIGSIYNFILFITFLILSLSISKDDDSWRKYGDSYDYIIQSEISIFSSDFYAPEKTNFYPRPITIPLFYKLAQQDPTAIITLQIIFHWLSAFVVSFALMLFIKKTWIKLLLVTYLYLLFSWWNVFGWTFLLLSESITNSLLFIWIASLLLLKKYNNNKLLVTHILVSLLLSFTRDSWPYILISLYGTLILLSLKWDKVFVRKYLLLLSFSIVLFFVQQKAAETGQRYRLPVMNNIFIKILPNKEYTNWFEKEGLPQIAELKERIQNGEKSNIYSIYEDSTFTEFNNWVLKKGKSTYMKFLFSHPRQLLLMNETKRDYDRIFCYNIGYVSEAKSFSKQLSLLQPLFHPVFLWFLLLLLVIIFIYEINFVYLLPIIFSWIIMINAYLMYTADGLEMERHLFVTLIVIEFIIGWSIAFILDAKSTQSLFVFLRKKMKRVNALPQSHE